MVRYEAKEPDLLMLSLAEDLAKANSKNRLLKIENEKLKKALRFYANYDNYSINTAHKGHDVISDNGEIARDILFYRTNN